MTCNVEAIVRGLKAATIRLRTTVRTQPVNANDVKTGEEAAEAYRAGLLDSILNHIRRTKEQQQ